MGNPFFKLKCNDCNYQEDLYTGFSYDGKLIKCYYCKNCMKIYSLQDNEVKHYCKSCGSELIEIEFLNADLIDVISPINTNVQLHCPKCKRNNIKINFSGLWD